ncbi:ABC transporter substrate-binding protein [Alkalinema pantanalense CENA528]|uniref:ABC transporter substrate-binding protein n=1 Tax=Alkalinema pantanalense TaxID=1620705 RepID=UPI003D6F403C
MDGIQERWSKWWSRQSSNAWQQFCIWGLLGLLASWLISCGGNAQKSSGAAEVEFWTMQLQPQYTSYFNQLISRFEAENPGTKVKWVDVPWAAMESKILTSVAAKTAPDVVNLNPNFASQLAEKDVWMDLSSKVPPQVQQQYLPNIWKASTLENKTFGLPWYLTTRIAIYNRDLLKQAGLDTPPATFAELFKAAQQIKDKTGKYAFFATLVPTDSGEVLESFVQQGVTLVDGQGKAAFNTPQGKAIFQSWVDLYKNGLLPKEVLTEGHRHGIDLYQQGETAILSSSPEFLRTVSNNAPTIAKVSAPAAQLTGSTGKKNVAVMNLVIPKMTDQPEAALKFALFVTNNENQLAFAKAANVLPSTQAALQDPYFSQVPAQATALDQARIISAQQLKEAEVLIPAMKNIKQLQKLIYENLQAAMLGQKSVDQAIADAAQAWNEAS